MPGLSFTLREDETVEITKYGGKAEELEISAKLDGKRVTRIGEGAFAACKSLTGVTIPDSVTEIGRNAFYDCTGLCGITIPDSVTRIGEGAFAACRILPTLRSPMV